MDRFIYDSEEFRDELEKSPHRAGEVTFLRSIATPGMHVIEAGSHTGVTAVALAREIGKSGRLYAFEPVPEYYAQLKDNLSRNGVDNATAYRLALSNRAGRTRFYKRGGGSGITPGEDVEMLWVETATIADFVAERKIDRLDLLNLDCEGSELLVFQGAKTVLEERGPQIFCEIHHGYLKELSQSANDIIAFLMELSYDVQPLQVENLDAESTFEKCSHIYARKRVQQENVRNVQELKRKIADLNERMPAHSVSPSMMQELEELEEQLEAAQENLKRRNLSG